MNSKDNNNSSYLLIPPEIKYNLDLTTAAHVVILAEITYYSKKEFGCVLNNKYFMTLARVKSRAVNNILTDLENLGLIIRQYNPVRIITIPVPVLTAGGVAPNARGVASHARGVAPNAPVRVKQIESKFKEPPLIVPKKLGGDFLNYIKKITPENGATAPLKFFEKWQLDSDQTATLSLNEVSYSALAAANSHCLKSDDMKFPAKIFVLHALEFVDS